MKLINITVTSSRDPRTLKYRVRIKTATSTWVNVHYGKFYVPASTTTITLDLDDLLINYKYRGQQSLEPVLNVSNNQYQMPSSAAGYISDYYYNTVEVSSLDSPSAFTTVTKDFYFLPVQVFGYDLNITPSALNIPSVTDGLIPHIPANPPAGFNFGVVVYNSSSSSISAQFKKDNNTFRSTSISGGRVYYCPLTGATKAYFVNTTKVAQIDECNKPYYLLWLDNAGGLQCQGFLKTSEFGRKYDNKTRVDNKNIEWKVTSTTTGNWKLKSDNLTDSEYRVYGELFNSPYLCLIDTVNSRIHYVNVGKSDYTEKKKTRTSKKPIYFELELNSAEHMRV